ncbi:MAG: DEAD/DEAH box helicase family protein [Trueperaceae bacterium]|nr:DEAD/DEAH box helicase family protein [Trueperaceae bacterium]
MSNAFFEQPILNPPYERPSRHWELTDEGQPTQKVLEFRRPARFFTPIPKARKQSSANEEQQALVFDEGKGLSTSEQSYEATSQYINDVRQHVDSWRDEGYPGVTPETGRLLWHWRDPHALGRRPFFCQLEAVETVVWLTEIAPSLGASSTKGKAARVFLDRLNNASKEANPGLERLALKLATGAGKTMVMAMIVAWQAINAVRHPQSSRFTKGFLIVTPGITIRDRLRVLLPSDPLNYYRHQRVVPPDLLPELGKAKVIITNYHAFKRRERYEIAKGTRELLEGRTGDPVNTVESEGQMLRRVMPDLMGMRNVLVLNDEAHHCYREKPNVNEQLTGDDRKEAEQNAETARLWISGLEAVQRKLGVRRVLDLSATPFFLQGSGYAEGTLFPWTMVDFSLMDAIECGIVKLPRVPVADDIPTNDVPMYRELWTHIRNDMPRKPRGKRDLDPQKLPAPLYTALEALYGHYEDTFEAWLQEGLKVPPCFIIVCNNTATSKAVYDWISGYTREHEDGTEEFVPGWLELFHNHDQNHQPLARPNTLLIDSQQLESDEALDKNFREAASDEIERFRRAVVERKNDPHAADNVTDQNLLREVMNTVGKPGELGAEVRCVVSVAMLTEGWDANTVTHVLGVRAFGSQLLCEQVIGRALRRQSYELNEDGLFDVEYADVLGIPFDFTAKPVVAPPQPPRETVRVHAVRPDRDALEIEFPRVQGYRVEIPNETLRAEFDVDSTFALTPEQVGATRTETAGIIGRSAQLDLSHTDAVRPSEIVYHLTAHLLDRWRDPGEAPRTHLFSQLKRIVRQWLDHHLKCQGGTYPAQLLYRGLADQACERIMQGIIRASYEGEKRILAIPDPFTPTGSTAEVSFTTSRRDRWETRSDRCHVNWVVLDSGWEAEFCRAVENHPRTLAYVKNHGLGFEVPYHHMGERRVYVPDFIVRLDDGRGADDPLNLVVEIKGYRGEDAKDKATTMRERWVPGVKALDSFGRWAFTELKELWEIESDLATVIEKAVDEMLSAPDHDASPDAGDRVRA